MIRSLFFHRGPTWLAGVFVPMSQQSDVEQEMHSISEPRSETGSPTNQECSIPKKALHEMALGCKPLHKGHPLTQPRHSEC